MVGVDWGVIASFSGIFVVVIGAVIARDRQIVNMIHTNHGHNTAAVADAAKVASDEAKALHSRVNRLREHVDTDYVRSDALDGHLQRIETGLGEMRKEMREERRETHNRLDAVLTAIGKNG